jgi:ATP adenylyltransferase
MDDQAIQFAGTTPSPLDSAPPTAQERLWTPWRMRYVGGGTAEPGCLFCNRLAAGDDVRSLILHRGNRAFVIMNLYPYNTGHVMIVPNDHVASPETTDEETLGAMATLLRLVLRALRRSLNADGFNAGLNVGAVAGAGVADHLHQHVVPRWQGDANFMPILASTMVLPELIPVTYAKIRAELVRELAGLADAPVTLKLAILDQDTRHVLLRDGALPSLTVESGQAIWGASAQFLAASGVEAVLAGWAGPALAAFPDSIALTYLSDQTPPSGSALRLWPVDEAMTTLATDDDRSALRNAMANLAPAGS